MSKNKTTERILGDMITSFIPATKEELNDADTLLLTTEELIARMQPVMDVNKEELVRMLYETGFRLTYYGDTWKWALKYV